MAKKAVAKRSAKSITNAERAFLNGISEAIFGGPFNIGSVGTQLNQVDTLFKNNRWYMVSNMRQVLSESYVEHGIIQTLVDVPVDDALRGGLEIKTKLLSEDEIQKLDTEMQRQGDLRIAGQSRKWTRLFGGGGIIILTNQDPSTPLDVNGIGPGEPMEFRAVDMWELFWDKQNTEGFSATLQSYTADIEYFNYYGVKLHKSRVMKMKGLEAPSFVRPRLRGWGFSIVEILINSVNQYLKSNNLIFEVLDEFKVDVYKIKNFANTLLQANGTNKVQERIQLANMQKNFQHAISMDSEDDYLQKELSFTGIAETMAGIRMQIASDMRMPLTKVFGISSAGFNSGEDDIENYNSMVENQVRAPLKFDLLRMVELRCMNLFGHIPDDLSINFEPLRILSSEQEENVKTQRFARVLQARQAGEIDSKEFREMCNRDELLPMQMDVEAIPVGPEVDEHEEPGDNKTDSKQSKVRAKEAKETKEARSARNSIEFDIASYEADGGDAWIHPDRLKLFMNPGKVDEGLWAKAKEASHKAFGKDRWPFIVWWYEKQGGKFR